MYLDNGGGASVWAQQPPGRGTDLFYCGNLDLDFLLLSRPGLAVVAVVGAVSRFTLHL